MNTWVDDAKKAAFDCLIGLEILAGFVLVWVLSWMPVYKGWSEANDGNWIWLILQGLFFLVLTILSIAVTYGAKQRKYPPKPKQVAVSVSPSSPKKPPSTADLDDIEERLQNLEDKK